ncbi:MAG: hypothetical protein M1541_09745, partial [Acidobacteria bacterium]|nr:hypothetical protein [Acidobacteriota bacterium]
AATGRVEKDRIEGAVEGGRQLENVTLHDFDTTRPEALEVPAHRPKAHLVGVHGGDPRVGRGGHGRRDTSRIAKFHAGAGDGSAVFVGDPARHPHLRRKRRQ